MEGGAEGIKAFSNRVFRNNLRELVCHDGRGAVEGEEGSREVAVCGIFGLGLFGISQPQLQSRLTLGMRCAMLAKALKRPIRCF